MKNKKKVVFVRRRNIFEALNRCNFGSVNSRNTLSMV